MTATMGALVGVGVGPGDPEHLTLKAIRELQAADRVFVPGTQASGDGPGRAERLVLQHVGADRVERAFFAMSDGASRDAAWDAAGARIAEVIRGGGTAAFATLGDPSVYSTFAYVVHTVRELARGCEVRVVPGITAMQDLAARTGQILTEGAERLALVPWTAGEEVLRDELSRDGTVVVYKGGRELDRVLACVGDAGRLDDAVFGKDLGTEGEDIGVAAGRTRAPYFSTVVVPARRDDRRGGRL